MKTKLFTSAILLFSLVAFVTTSSHAQCCVAPANLIAFNIGHSEADLQWDRVSQLGCTTPKKYTVRYRVVGTSTWTKFMVKTHVDDLTGDTSLSNLTPLTTYQWQVRGTCPGGTKTAWIAGPNFTTLAARLDENGFPVVANNLIARVYPTVIQNAISIVGQLRSAGDIAITVTNITGQKVLEQSLHFDAGEFTTAVDLSNLSSGYYTVSINNGNERITTKIEKQ